MVRLETNPTPQASKAADKTGCTIITLYLVLVVFSLSDVFAVLFVELLNLFFTFVVVLFMKSLFTAFYWKLLFQVRLSSYHLGRLLTSHSRLWHLDIRCDSSLHLSFIPLHIDFLSTLILTSILGFLPTIIETSVIFE